MDISPSALLPRYRNREIRPSDVMAHVLERLADPDQSGVWISTVQPDAAMKAAESLDARHGDFGKLPLYGLVLSVKDCIDVAGVATTCACPEFAYIPDDSSHVVERALAAGALFVGKTNMDQFATGLVGVRTPYGTARNPHNAEFIPGGSSSGAAVSVATGTSSIALGTDTGGSGRVPAAYCGVTGLKPAPGMLSRHGMTYACRSFDTISIYAKSPEDAMIAFDVVAGFDPKDCFSTSDDMRRNASPPLHAKDARVAVPAKADRKFFGDAETEALFGSAINRAQSVFADVAEAGFKVFTDVNDLMFFGPFLTERYISVGRFLEDNPGAGEEVVRDLILKGKNYASEDVYRAFYQVAETKRRLVSFWRDHDALMVPTVGTYFTVDEVRADPLGPNFNNGYYTNFANPLGLAAVSVPYGKTGQGVPYGVTFLGLAGTEGFLAELGAVLMDGQLAQR